MDKPQINFGDFFVGSGGLSLGFLLANEDSDSFYKPLFAIDNNSNALETYSKSMNWLGETKPCILPKPPSIFKKDINALDSNALLRLFKMQEGELDLLIGGPPCQGYSNSNRKSSSVSKNDRNRLTKIFFDKIEDIRPKMFLIENVQGLKWSKPTKEMELSDSQLSLFSIPITPSSNVQEYLLDRARSLGYNVWCGILNALDFGVPQNRHRFFLFGVRSDIFPMSCKIPLDIYLNELRSNKIITVGEAINDLPEIGNGEIWAGKKYKPVLNEYVKKMRIFMKNGDLKDHFSTKHTEYVIERFKKIPEGQNWESIRNLMSNYVNIDNTHSNIYRRLRADAPAITISHYRKSMIIHPKQDRGLSFREACRLQSFPDWYVFSGPSDNKQQQLANAVPPLLASKIALSIAKFWANISELRSVDSHPQDLLLGDV